MRIHNNKGFTLIELLVVIAIIGMLASVVLASLNSARSKARDASRLSDMKQLQLALEMYYDDNNRYPTQTWAHSAGSGTGTWSTLQTELAPYLTVLPKDPQNTGDFGYNGSYVYSYYSYGYGGPGQWYMLVFRLENSPHRIEAQDGVRACNGHHFHYGNNSNGIITLGGSC